PVDTPPPVDNATHFPDPMWIHGARWSELGECDDPDANLRRDMVQDFLASLTARIEALEAACASHRPEHRFEAAHALKGAAENLGAQTLGRACAAIELADEISPILL